MIGGIIQKKRKQAGLTQAQLAQLLGVTAPAVNRWEKNLAFPDAALLAPLARCLKTDINTLFSFYDSLTDKERSLIVEKVRTMLVTQTDEEILAYIEQVLRENLSDGQLHLQIANALYGAHLLKKAYLPTIYLHEVQTYFERALELCPESEQEICEALMSVCASLGDTEKATYYWSRMSGSKLERIQSHCDMLFLLKDYPAAAEELKALVLHKAVALSVDLGLLHDTLIACHDTALAEMAKEKADSIRKLFELWEGFEILSLVSTAVSVADGDAHSKYIAELVSLNPRGKSLSASPLFEGVQLGAADSKDGTIADSMADVMAALSKL